ncbi:SSI family serine proteinase inhibitor [Streptomyces sp. NPDC101213]|uniref:SSI family serine proteinase inhibitor n=1 Tax=unclassified Streptomyces TaxID=2593676 RepID=UPI0037025363
MKHFPAPRLLAALPGTAALLLAAVAPAQASAPGHALPGDGLRLTVTTGDSRSGDTRGTLLLCDPPQGHSRAAEACADLTAANGDIDAVAPREAVCSLLYAPVTARANGWWHGRPVAYTETFSNTCVMLAETGAVFALDDEQLPELPELPGLPGPSVLPGG